MNRKICTCMICSFLKILYDVNGYRQQGKLVFWGCRKMEKSSHYNPYTQSVWFILFNSISWFRNTLRLDFLGINFFYRLNCRKWFHCFRISYKAILCHRDTGHPAVIRVSSEYIAGCTYINRNLIWFNSNLII